MKASPDRSVQEARLITDRNIPCPNDKDEEMKGGSDQLPRRAAFVGDACLFTVHLVKSFRLIDGDRTSASESQKLGIELARASQYLQQRSTKTATRKRVSLCLFQAIASRRGKEQPPRVS